MWPFSRQSSQVQIRRFSAGQADACARIHAASFEKAWHAAEISRLAMESTVLAEVALAPKGDAVWGFSLARHVAGEAEILTIAVDPARRGAGVGKALLQAQLRLLTEAGVREVFLEVDGANQSALALYGRLGFTRVGERKAYYSRAGGPPASALILRLALS
jgi:ribosomal-protein-alanine N-acetyltransferase